MYEVICPLSTAARLRKSFPQTSYAELAELIEFRSFRRWYKRNQKAVNMLAVTVPAVTLALFGNTIASLLPYSLQPAIAVGTTNSFFTGQGAILLHMLIIGFVTMIITTFLKFTGRGDIVPLVAFVSGGIVLSEVIGLFNGIYNAVRTFLTM